MKRMGIVSRFTLMVLLPVILLTITLTGISIYQTKAIITDHFTESFGFLQENISIFVEEKLKRIADQPKSIIANLSLQRLLSDDGSMMQAEKEALISDIQEMTTNIMISSRDIDTIYVYDLGGNLLFGERSFPLDRTLDRQTLRHIAETQGFSAITAKTLSRNKYILLVRSIKSTATFKPIGYVQITCREDVISQIYLDRINEYNAILCIQKNDGTILTAMGGENVIERYIDALPDPMKERQYGEIVLDGRKMLFLSYRSPASGWNYISLVPKSNITKRLSSVYISSILVMLLFSAIASVAGIIMARNIASPIREVSASLRKVSQGDYSVQVRYGEENEIGDLALAFNRMVSEINRLINEVLKLELFNKEQEIKAMQAQINPHFLSNIFEAINALARQYNAEPISRVILSLSRLMRMSIAGVGNEVTIEEELSMADCYLEIQKIRFAERLRVHYDINDELLKVKIPKLIIEPIVENAIIHGFRDKAGECVLEIRIFRDVDDVVIEVCDNGVGMSEKTLGELFSSIDHPAGSGVHGMGIALVEKRLRLIFGVDQALIVTSSPGRGTVVCIRIPKIRAHSAEEIGNVSYFDCR